MLPSPAMGLPPTTLLEVGVSPEMADIHEEFAPLLRLSGICAPSSGGSSSTAVWPNGTSSGAGPSTGGFSGGDEEEVRGRRSPAVSPVRAGENKLAELMAPVMVTLPPPMSDEDAASIDGYVRHYRAQEEYERAYIALIFQEYKKRKSVEQRRDDELASLLDELKQLRQRELRPEVRAALCLIASEEAAARAAVQDAYDKFLKWVEETTPQWIEAAQRQEQRRMDNEKAKKAAMAAAREALAQELAMGRLLSDVSGRTSPHTLGAVSGLNEDGIPSYKPAVSVERQMQASLEVAEALSPTELRRKAIRMLEAEEAEMKHRREQQLCLLRVQEEQLRAEIALKAQHKQEEAERREREAEQKRKDELARRYDALLQEEFTLQSRMREREEKEARKEAERCARLAQVANEEEQLRRRIKETEDRRKASEEEAARVARDKKMREVREQEEALRQRIAERTAAAEAERLDREAEARIRAEAEAVRAEQEEALRRVRQEQEQREKQQQLAYLRDQEEAYKRRTREKELAEIEEKRRALESQWQHRAAATPAWAGHSAPSTSAVSLAMPPAIVPPAACMAPPQASVCAYTPAVPPYGYQPMPAAPAPSAVAPGVYYPYLNPVAVAVPTAGMPPLLRPEYSGYPFAQPPYPPVAQQCPQPYPPATMGHHPAVPHC
ncbi:hypothetical protein GH5_04611 [Leishmania sp. Ghana 2012 LV757]|uniref:hypothetical protein n=1 Tax=Leishmania sp. Ghana 2012 LV757 TaxID=2803181 RepID=UPI001B492666|nr:hypothetical protein GH5_04611 [Leishmania sp. Ghana 2012 LV757]